MGTTAATYSVNPQLKIYNDFRGGICHDLAPDNKPENSVDTADNVVINSQGGFTRRLGETYLNATSYGAQVEQLVEYTKNDGTDLLLGIVGTELCKISQTDGTLTSIIDLGTANAGFTYDNDNLLFCNGTYYDFYDGTTAGTVKVTAPTVAPTVIKYYVPAPTLTDYYDSGNFRYRYKITFVMPDDDDDDNENGLEFRASEFAERETSHSAPSITLSNIAIDPLGMAVKRKIYRTARNGSTYYLIATLNDNTTTVYNDIHMSDNTTASALDEASLEGTYKICYTFVKTNSSGDVIAESDKSPTTDFTINSYGFKITVPISSDSTVTQRNIYRSLANETTMYLVGSIYDNTSTTFYDSLEDEDNVGDELTIDNDVDLVNKCTMITRHPKSGRFFAAGNTDDQAALYYSEIARPDYFKSDSVLYPTSGDGPVTALASFGDAIFAFYSKSIWMYRGTDPSTDSTWERVPTGHGCTSQWSIIQTPNSLSWLGYGGFYVMSPSVVGYGNISSLEDSFLTKNLAKDKIITDIADFKTPSICSGVFDSVHNRALWACTDSNGTRNNIIYCFQWENQSFTTWSGINANYLMSMRDGTIYAACNNYILKLNQGYNAADGTAITADVKSKPYHLGLLFNRKRFMRLLTEFKAPDDDIIISFKVYVDDVLTYEADHTSATTGFTWGTSTWGEDRWGTRSMVATRNRIFANGHRLVIEFSCDQLDAECVVYSFGVEYRVLKAKGDKI